MINRFREWLSNIEFPDKWLKWFIWLMVAVVMFFGGAAIRFNLMTNRVTVITPALRLLQLIGTLGMIMGTCLFGFLLLYFVYKNIKT